MFGVLNVNKPAGMTSREVVNQIQRQVRPFKTGHAGTLDPLATGVLVVCIGKATRLISCVQQLPKQYRASFLLGRLSDTEDVDGDVRLLEHAPVITAADVRAVLGEFVGTIKQRPPAYSALKVSGKRAYQLARRGEAVDLPARPVVIHELTLVRFAYPEMVLDVCCGSGTYIRSLGRDIAVQLQSGAVMSALQRTAIGPYVVTSAMPPDQLTRAGIELALLPPESALAQFPKLTLTAAEAIEIAHGRPIPNRSVESGEAIVAVSADQQLLAILSDRDGKLHPTRNFAAVN